MAIAVSWSYRTSCQLALENGGKCNLNYFGCGIVVGAQKTGLNISETAGLQGFLCTTLFRVKLM